VSGDWWELGGTFKAHSLSATLTYVYDYQGDEQVGARNVTCSGGVFDQATRIRLMRLQTSDNIFNDEP
jgi:hypothetical protein